MDTVIHFLTEPDHLMFLGALVAMWLGDTDKKWFTVFAVAGLTWVIGSHILIG